MSSSWAEEGRTTAGVPLYQRDHRFHFVLCEQALYTTVGNDAIMRGQLDRLAAIIGMPRITLGIVPPQPRPSLCPRASRCTTHDSSWSKAPRPNLRSHSPERSTYGRAFNVLASQAITGEAARNLIRTAISIRLDQAVHSPELHRHSQGE
ncbi:Scr1 family TA system antitoxin-like transcriptional regulator [Nocardia transvalensis]|uniref:Scr1 family TA system antitoxin-like transcriptional regulator n=1 Tax=Nocardia transvalensis TaxID=37333 RepID=UPI00357114C1